MYEKIVVRSKAVADRIRKALGPDVSERDVMLIDVFANVFVSEIYRPKALAEFARVVESINLILSEHDEVPAMFMSTEEQATWASHGREARLVHEVEGWDFRMKFKIDGNFEEVAAFVNDMTAVRKQVDQMRRYLFN